MKVHKYGFYSIINTTKRNKHHDDLPQVKFSTRKIHAVPFGEKLKELDSAAKKCWGGRGYRYSPW